MTPRARSRGLLRLVSESPRVLLVAALAAVVEVALLVPVALLIRRLFDDHVPERDSGAIALSGVAILALYVASTAVAIGARRVAIAAAKGTVTRLRHALVDAVHALPHSRHAVRDSGDLHSLLVLDMENVDKLVSQLVSPVLPALLVSAALGVLALAIDPLLFGLTVAIMLPLVLAAHRLASRSRRMGELFNARLRAFSRRVQLALRGLGATRVHGVEAWAAQRQRDDAAAVGDAGRLLAEAQSAQSLVQNAVAASAAAVVLVAGGIGVAEERISIGELFAFYAVVALLLRQIGKVMPGLAALPLGLDSLARVETFLARREPEPYSGTRPATFDDELRLEGVGFSYGGRRVLRDVNLVVSAGEHVALVGPNGAGKSTIASLIFGLHKPQEGRLTADGVPYEALDMRALRRSIGAALQDPVLFPGTIAENIAFGRDDVDEAAVRAAAAIATADDFVERQRDGYDTEVGEEAALLSGGERQRLAIARALVGRPRLIVLDEPTTHLDDKAITQLLTNLEQLPWRPALLVITHDAELARRADRVLVVRDGLVAEAGAAAVAPGG